MMIDIANKIKNRRKFLGYNQHDLAELSGISERTIRSLENGFGGVKIETLIKVLDALGLNINIQFKPMSDETRKSIVQ